MLVLFCIFAKVSIGDAFRFQINSNLILNTHYLRIIIPLHLYAVISGVPTAPGTCKESAIHRQSQASESLYSGGSTGNRKSFLNSLNSKLVFSVYDFCRGFLLNALICIPLPASLAMNVFSPRRTTA